mmetsp:Transcript_102496/g.256814  ORF Transcript_102496/g.256814 Transcript_102496/m.256814 type:complete len:200 (-) Transcript_102496:488-1087(-)
MPSAAKLWRRRSTSLEQVREEVHLGVGTDRLLALREVQVEVEEVLLGCDCGNRSFRSSLGGGNGREMLLLFGKGGGLQVEVEEVVLPHVQEILHRRGRGWRRDLRRCWRWGFRLGLGLLGRFGEALALRALARGGGLRRGWAVLQELLPALLVGFCPGGCGLLLRLLLLLVGLWHAPLGAPTPLLRINFPGLLVVRTHL